MERKFESLWELNDLVSISFPGNGVINLGKIIKISFTNGFEPLYDVEVPFRRIGEGEEYENAYTRLHGIKEWHLRIPQGDAVTPSETMDALIQRFEALKTRYYSASDAYVYPIQKELEEVKRILKQEYSYTAEYGRTH